jgi:3-hydroxyisobutyrate dehydrogenase-like beta-hydroxyacid dehydrogenase
MTVAVLHPGQMGATVAAACRAPVLWVGEGRSEATRRRAADAGLEEVATLAEAADRAQLIVSVCPPAAAVDLARAVAATGWDGLYVDANAVSPATARGIGELVPRYVDGGIVGPPALRAGTTRLYLSGPGAAEVAELWAGGPLEPRVVEGGPGAASAVKMAYAAWTKGNSALLFAVRALAEAEGVSGALDEEWAISQPDLAGRLERIAAGASPKAWRWVGEMEEIAATFGAAGLPDGFHLAAADIYRRLAGFRDAESSISPEAAIGAILDGSVA